jgi:Tfp pilus assembly protein PilW
VQENGRFALDYINSTVRSAEYSQDIANPTVGIVTDENVSNLIKVDVKYITRNDLTALGKGSSDQLVTRMWVSQTMIDAGFRDCEGNAVASPRFLLTRYFVGGDESAGSTAALRCDAGSYQEGAAEMDKVSGSFNYGDDGIVLLSNLDSFQFFYGVAALPTPELGQRYPVRYLTASEYTLLPAASRPVIVSLRVGLLVRSNEKVGTNITTLPDVKVLEKTITGTDLNDKFIHRLFTSTLALRNAI